MLKLIRNKTFLIPAAILGFIGIVFFISTVFSQLGRPDLGNQLQGYWTMREFDYIASSSTMIDRSGNGNDATIYNPNFIDNRQGVVNGAVDYNDNQTTEYLSLPNNVLDGATDFTIAFWAYGGGSGEYIVSISDGSNHNHLLMKAPTAPGWHFYVWRRNSVYGDHIYQDLAETDSLKHTAPPTTLSVAEGGLIIAQEQDALGGGFASTQSFSGAISDIRVYKRGLTNEEMKMLYGRSLLNYSGKGLVGHWTLDAKDYNFTSGQLKDKSPYNNNCINYGSIFATDRNDLENSSVDFQGSAYFRCSNNSLQITGDQTYAFWIMPRQFSERRNPINIAYGGEGTITMETSGAFSYYYGTGGGNAPPYQGHGSGQAISLNEWSHVAHVRDITNNEMVWYINGERYAPRTPDYVEAVASGYDLYIGDGYVSPIDGMLDDVRIYNRALSQEEIKSLYGSYDPKTTTGTFQQGLVFDMPLKIKYTKDETSGSEILTDRTPYSNDGQNYGATVSSSGTDFSGVSDYVLVPDDEILDITKSITMSFWYKIPELNQTQRIITKNTSGGAHGKGYEVSFYNTNRFLTVYNNENSRIYLYSDYINDPSDVGEYFHYTYVYNYEEGYQRVFINGEEFSSNGSFITNFEAGSNAGADLEIGKRDGDNGEGELSNLLIYNRALSGDEVKTLYGRGRSDAGIIFQPEN